MVIMKMSETKSGAPPCDVSPSTVADDDDDLDGWGPVRPRRSSMPAPLSADAPREHGEPREHSERIEARPGDAISDKSPARSKYER